MARKTEYGSFIISANEVGAYTVCPEAWRLRVVAGVRPNIPETVNQGQKLHSAWAKNIDEILWFTRAIKIFIGLLLLALLVYTTVQLVVK